MGLAWGVCRPKRPVPVGYVMSAEFDSPASKKKVGTDRWRPSQNPGLRKTSRAGRPLTLGAADAAEKGAAASRSPGADPTAAAGSEVPGARLPGATGAARRRDAITGSPPRTWRPIRKKRRNAE